MGMIWQKRLFWILFGFSACAALFLPARLAAQEPTPTPDAEGVIIIIVQPNDTLWAISARAGLTLQELLALNGLSETDFILPGQQLIIGYGEPPTTPTADVSLTPTATLPPPTPGPPTATPPRTAVCLSAFQDVNGNGLHDSDELLQAAVAFTVYTDAAVVGNYVTDGISEPHCIQVEPGSYQITRSRTAEERLTTSGNQAISLNLGDVMYLTFGGQSGAAAFATQPAANPGAASDTEGNTAVVIGQEATIVPTSSPNGGQPDSAISLIPIGAVIIGGLMLTGAIIFIVRTRAKANTI